MSTFLIVRINDDRITWQVGLLMATTVILFIMGMIVQFRMNRGRDHGLKG